jgi:hypothetical protein
MRQQCFGLQIPSYDMQSWLAGQQQLVGITNLQTVAQETQKYASQVERERERELDPSLDLILLMRYGLFCQLISCCRQVVRGLVNFVEEPIPSSSSSSHHLV